MGLKHLLLAGYVGLSVGCADPEIKEIKDWTGDGIEDILIQSPGERAVSTHYLFVGQKNGSYLKTKYKISSEGVDYFVADSGDAYFFNGKHYTLSPKK